MASLLARFFTGSRKVDLFQNTQSNQMQTETESISKLCRKPVSPVKARKSITSLFGFAARVAPQEDGFDNRRPLWQAMSDFEGRHDVLVHTIATCQEAQHYPLYDPTNPNHEPSLLQAENQNLGSTKRRLSRSPTKKPLWKRSPSPRRHPAPNKAMSMLQGLADTLRAKANIFYEEQKDSSEEELMPHDASGPPTPNSAKSFCSKKSVRFRSGHSVIGNVRPHSSPIIIPTKSPPSLSMVNISSTPVFETTVDENKDLGQTARPPETLPLYIPLSPSPGKTSPPYFSFKIEDKAGSVAALPTPMPGTNLPLEDPFDDAARAALRSDDTTIVQSDLKGSDLGYISYEKSNAESDLRIETIPTTEMSSAQDVNDPAGENNETPGFYAFRVERDYCNGTSNISPSAPQRTLRRTKALHLPSKEQLNTLGWPSESQYDADAEPSDGSDTQNKSIESVAAKIKHPYESLVTDHNGSSELGVNLARCKTPLRQRSATPGAVPRLTLERASSNETEESASSILTDRKEMIQSAGSADKNLIGVETSLPSGTSRISMQTESLISINCRSTYRSVESPFERVENENPGISREPTKVDDRCMPLNDDYDSSQQLDTSNTPVDIRSISVANSVSPLQLAATVSSTSLPHQPWQLGICHGTNETVDAERLEHRSPSARRIWREVRGQPYPIDTTLIVVVNSVSVHERIPDNIIWHSTSS
jgi:hypothetical protein